MRFWMCRQYVWFSRLYKCFFLLKTIAKYYKFFFISLFLTLINSVPVTWAVASPRFGWKFLTILLHSFGDLQILSWFMGWTFRSVKLWTTHVTMSQRASFVQSMKPKSFMIFSKLNYVGILQNFSKFNLKLNLFWLFRLYRNFCWWFLWFLQNQLHV